MTDVTVCFPKVIAATECSHFFCNNWHVEFNLHILYAQIDTYINCGLEVSTVPSMFGEL